MAILTTELNDGVLTISMDDGKANALGHDMLGALEEAFTQAQSDASAVVLVGRPGKFSAGFDLKVMLQSAEAAQGLLRPGATFLARLLEFPKPVVAACTGHAIAAGGMLLLASDIRIGMPGAFKIGLNEVANGMELPVFGMDLARFRVSTHHLNVATLQAHMYDPTTAVESGFLDRVTDADALLAEAQSEAARLGALPAHAYAGTKRRLRGEVAQHMRDTLEDDLKALLGQ